MPDVQRGIGSLPEYRLRRVTGYIDSNLHGKLRLADLGAVAHMSPYHFARLFKVATGVSPHRFVLRRRIAAATALLTDSTASITSIARTVGFTSASHFATMFRREAGVTPTVYRRGTGVGSAAIETSAAPVSTASVSAPPSS